MRELYRKRMPALCSEGFETECSECCREALKPKPVDQMTFCVPAQLPKDMFIYPSSQE